MVFLIKFQKLLIFSQAHYKTSPLKQRQCDGSSNFLIFMHASICYSYMTHSKHTPMWYLVMTQPLSRSTGVESTILRTAMGILGVYCYVFNDYLPSDFNIFVGFDTSCDKLILIFCKIWKVTFHIGSNLIFFAYFS